MKRGVIFFLISLRDKKGVKLTFYPFLVRLKYAGRYGRVIFLSKKLIAISQERCTNQGTVTLMTTLLPDWVTYIFPSREIDDSYRLSKQNLFIFISVREFSFYSFCF